MAELRKLIVGQDDVIEQVLISLFAGGNSIITGVPGLAKTLIIHTLAQVLDLKFSRIQFTPDLMPSDITGTDIIQEDPATGRRQLVFTPGPIFATSCWPTRSTARRPRRRPRCSRRCRSTASPCRARPTSLEEPFFVFATQNPIEQEGTYPLPEAQLDRFMFDIVIDYLPEDEEMEVVRATTAIQDLRFERAVTGRGHRRLPDAGAPGAGGGRGDPLRGGPGAHQPALGARTRPTS